MIGEYVKFQTEYEIDYKLLEISPVTRRVVCEGRDHWYNVFAMTLSWLHEYFIQYRTNYDACVDIIMYLLTACACDGTKNA